jgi:hypothetical protein
LPFPKERRCLCGAKLFLFSTMTTQMWRYPSYYNRYVLPVLVFNCFIGFLWEKREREREGGRDLKFKREEEREND